MTPPLQRSLLGAAFSVSLALAAACGPSPAPSSDAGADAEPHGCTTGFVGDASKDVEIAITVIGTSPTATLVNEGDVVPVIFPPQGGRVIFAGARAKNLDACGVTLTGAVRDLATKQVRVDARTVNLLPAADGFVETDPTDFSTFSNVPVCPNQWSDTDIFGTEYELEITIADRAGRTATKTLRVTPECAEPDRKAECLCICKAGYVLGETCADAGAGDAGAGGSGGSG